MDFKLEFNAIECDITELEIGDKFIGANSSGLFMAGEVSAVMPFNFGETISNIIGVEMYNGDCLYYGNDDFEQYYKLSGNSERS